MMSGQFQVAKGGVCQPSALTCTFRLSLVRGRLSLIHVIIENAPATISGFHLHISEVALLTQGGPLLSLENPETITSSRPLLTQGAPLLNLEHP